MRPSAIVGIAFAGIISVAGTACSGGVPASGVVIRDSAGITIVESFEPLWSAEEQWTVSEQPITTIGMDQGPEEYSLHSVTATLRLPDGTIVIANTGSDELRYYDSNGAFLYSVGQDGYGPGEFKRLWGTWLAGDSLVINDRGQDRVSVFSAVGEYGRTVMLDREPGSLTPNAVGIFSDGSIAGQVLSFNRDEIEGDGLRFITVNAVLRRYSPEGAILDSIGVFFEGESVSETIESSVDEATGVAYARSVGTSAPFARSATTRAFGNLLYFASAESYEIRVYSNEGELERLIRRPIPNSPVTESDKDQYREFWLEDNGDWGRRWVLDLEFPANQPAYGTVRVDAVGNIWVADYHFDTRVQSGNWTVFDPDGRMLGTVRVPPAWRIYDIGDDYILGVWRTELDVEQVRMYAITKGDIGTSR